MRRKFLLGIGLAAFGAAGAGSAIAADIPLKAGPPPPPPVSPAFIPDWVGFYIGIHGGGGGTSTSFEPQLSSNVLTPLLEANVTPHASGAVFGGQVGYNWQWGPAVGGLEIDFSGADLKGTSTVVEPFVIPALTVASGVTLSQELKIDELASARGRLGYLIFPNWLLYGTAGIGFGHTRLTSSAFGPLGNFASTTSEFDQFGWVVGAGLEWKFTPNWLLRGEWLHYDFGKVTVSPDVLAVLSASSIGLNVRNTVDIGRAAISYKF